MQDCNKAVIGIIPARLQSSRFPQKMLYQIAGKPLVQHTYESAKSASFLDDLYIATDDEKIFHIARSFGAKVLMTNSSCINGTQRTIDALHKNPELQEAQIIVVIQGDHPLIDPATIQSIVRDLQADDEAVMCTPVVPIKSYELIQNPNIVKCVFNQKNHALYFSRSPIPYYQAHPEQASAFQHIGLYAYRTEFLLDKLTDLPPSALQLAESLEQLQILEAGYKIRISVVQETPLAVDVPEDIEKIEPFFKNVFA